mmetsp:Transcript_5611/g.23322  ORF Transcript_5611/g.23322 Transcript_5611/m.23322 type:complete len:440 (-) Transcript_5611:675-1994(-)
MTPSHDNVGDRRSCLSWSLCCNGQLDEERRTPTQLDLRSCWKEESCTLHTSAGSKSQSLDATTGRSAPSLTAQQTSTLPSKKDVNVKEGFASLEFCHWYDLGPVIGRGSTSTVHKSTQLGTGKIFATKVITDLQLRFGEFDVLTEQFESELSALRACIHPNIIRLEDAIVTERNLYLVMEYLTGGELFDYVVGKGSLSEQEAATILRDVASAIAYMHDKNVIHRDLKPQVKIIDFGLSKILSDQSVHATSFLGTRGYLAPEMLKRQRYSKSVDVWAFGVITYILLCGCLPFDDDVTRISSPVAGRKFVLRYPSWAIKLSREAKEFLLRILDVDPNRRLTAQQAVTHIWLRPETHIPHHILQSPALIKDRISRTPKVCNRANKIADVAPLQNTCSTESTIVANVPWGDGVASSRLAGRHQRGTTLEESHISRHRERKNSF